MVEGSPLLMALVVTSGGVTASAMLYRVALGSWLGRSATRRRRWVAVGVLIGTIAPSVRILHGALISGPGDVLKGVAALVVVAPLSASLAYLFARLVDGERRVSAPLASDGSSKEPKWRPHKTRILVVLMVSVSCLLIGYLVGRFTGAGSQRYKPAPAQTETVLAADDLDIATPAATAPSVPVKHTTGAATKGVNLRALDGADEPSPADGDTPDPRVEPEVVQVPSGIDISRYYPEAAARKGIEGRAAISCLLSTRGTTYDCDVVYEEPVNMGFGDAALRMSKAFRFKPPKPNGALAESGRVHIPIRFAVPKLTDAPGAPSTLLTR